MISESCIYMPYPPYRIIAIIPTFNPDPNVVVICRSLRSQVDDIVIVDDGSSSISTSDILNECESLGCTILRRPENQGIATALNAGILYCRSFDPDFILTLDQDSSISFGYVEAMVATWKLAKASGLRLGMICPERINSEFTRHSGCLDNFSVAGEPIQSGLMIPIEALNEVGLFNEDYFIDCVETEFYLRVLMRKLVPLRAKGTNLKHTLGKTREVSILGKKITRNGVPIKQFYSARFRYYYISRNRTRLYLKYGVRFPRWAMQSLIEETAHQIRVLIFFPGRSAHLRVSLFGLWDGLRGSGGPIPRNVVNICSGSSSAV